MLLTRAELVALHDALGARLDALSDPVQAARLSALQGKLWAELRQWSATSEITIERPRRLFALAGDALLVGDPAAPQHVRFRCHEQRSFGADLAGVVAARGAWVPMSSAATSAAAGNRRKRLAQTIGDEHDALLGEALREQIRFKTADGAVLGRLVRGTVEFAQA